MEVNQIYDLVIIGGGAAGIMAAISFKRKNPNSTVVILDRSFEIGRKILVCGAGRCNITNKNLENNLEDVVSHYYTSNTDNQLVKDVFSKFNYENIVKFFEDLGVELYTERKTNIGKVFPITDSAKTITNVLNLELEKLGVKVFVNTEVIEIKKDIDIFVTHTKTVEIPERLKDKIIQPPKEKSTSIRSRFLILSAGGKTYPTLGANGSGYDLAKKLGHKIILPVPSALPLMSNHKICKLLSGQKMDMSVSSYISGNYVKSSFEDVMFTDYGLSGPAILNLSREISININRNNNIQDNCVKLNFLVDQFGKVRTKEWFMDRFQKFGSTYRVLIGIMPNKFAEILSKHFEYDLKIEKPEEIFDKLSSFEIEITGTKGWNEAEFTSGGVSLDEVQYRLESKIVQGLFFAGEILDVDGDVGGYNLSWAWASGYIAGQLK